MAANRRSLLALAWAVTLLLGALAGCGTGDDPDSDAARKTLSTAAEDLGFERGSNMD